MPRVLVATTSMSTKWESYSQTLLELLVPEWHRVVVDGRKSWTPTGFVENIIDRESDYIVHVDEDCFVRSREALSKLITILDLDDSIVAAGVPDGGYYYRNHNPAALNLFFVVFRTAALQRVWHQGNQWTNCRFRNSFADEVKRQCPGLDPERIEWDEAEPYYPLFWALLQGGGRFLYLTEQLVRSRWSSKVLLPSGEALAEHMWYLRRWFSDQVMPGHDCSNASRYKKLEADIRGRFGHYRGYSSTMYRMHCRRFIRRLLGKAPGDFRTRRPAVLA